MSRRIAVVGAGPGGLLLATLAKRADPDAEVTVFERNRADDTFGFGVVFSDATLAAVHAADPVLRDALAEHGVHWDDIEVRLKGERHRCGGNGMAAVRRVTLLRLLQERAADAGVDLRFSTPVDLDDVGGHDLVVAADGSGSRLRERLAPSFRPTYEEAAAKFIWFGTTYRFEGLTFVHAQGPDGTFAVHGYPIGEDLSTFIVETDEHSWRSAGLDEFDATQPPGPSDTTSRDYLQKLFAEQVDGAELLVNNSRWASFRTRRATSWRAGNVVLLGDAAHTAHFSVGSGTKMAMEDAIALAAALAEHPSDLDAALAGYESRARPSVERIQGSARPSLSWWEQFGRYHDAFEPWQFTYHFLTRSITDARLRRRDAGFVQATHDRWVHDHGAEPLESPLPLGRAGAWPVRAVPVQAGGAGGLAAVPGARPLPLLPAPPPGSSGPWGLWLQAPVGEAGLPASLAALAAAVPTGPDVVAVHGGAPLPRVLLCEQARLAHGVPALLVDDGLDRDAAVTAVLSGRADAVGAAPATVAGWEVRGGPAGR